MPDLPYLNAKGRSSTDYETLRSVITLQRVVYKLVPGLLQVEIDRVADFHRRYLENLSKITREIRRSCAESRCMKDWNSNYNIVSGANLHGLSD